MELMEWIELIHSLISKTKNNYSEIVENIF